MGVWYASRERLQGALDIRETARSVGQVDRALESGSRAAEGDLHRIFYPRLVTRTFDWPNRSYARPWRLWLDQHELISLDSITAGGVTLDPDDVLLRPDDGPPFTHIEVDLSTSATFAAGGTHQRAISLVGLAGYRDDTSPAGALADAIDASTTTVDVTNAAPIGVGNLLRVDDERMIVTGRRMLDTGQDLTASMSALASDVDLQVADGDQVDVDEVLLVDSERMLVVDIAGNTLTVRRAWDGSVLAAHSIGADVHAPRRLTVTRGAVGTTAAAHDDATAVTRWDPPGPLETYSLSLAINTLLQERAGYARTVGSAENEREAAGRGLRSARAEAWRLLGRKARIRGV